VTPGRYRLPALPVDVAVFAGRQRFAVGEVVEARADTYGMIVSRAVGPLTAFAQVRTADAEVNVSYTPQYDGDTEPYQIGEPIKFGANIESGARAGGGLTIRIIGLDLTGEYTAGPQNTVSVKTGFSVR
jgi:hypothetical protein